MWNKCDIFSLSIASLSFKMRFNFSYYNNGTLKHRDSESFCGCNNPVSWFVQVMYHITCMTGLCWCHGAILLAILLLLLAYLSWWAPNARCLVADDAFAGFSDNDRRRCRSVAQTSALLCGIEWTSFRHLLWHCDLNLPNLGWLISWYLDTSLCLRRSSRVAWRNCVINCFRFIVHNIHAYVLVKGTQSFAATFLSYNPTKYY